MVTPVHVLLHVLHVPCPDSIQVRSLFACVDYDPTPFFVSLFLLYRVWSRVNKTSIGKMFITQKTYYRLVYDKL